MTRTQALDADTPPPAWRVQTRRACATNGVRWFRAARLSRGVEEAYEVHRAEFGVCTREVDVRLVDALELEWEPGWADVEVEMLSEHPGAAAYAAWTAASEARILETSRVCEAERRKTERPGG